MCRRDPYASYGEIVLHEHSDMCWLPSNELHTRDWAEADIPVIQNYHAYLTGGAIAQ